MSRNLIYRVSVAVIAIPAILWTCYQGGEWLFSLLLVFALLALGEFLWREGWSLTDPLYWLTGITVSLLYVAVSGFAHSSKTFADLQYIFPQGPLSLWLLIGFLLISGVILAVRSKPPAELFASHSRLLWGVTYIGLLYPVVFLIGQGHCDISGGDWLLFLFGLLWVGDTAAMFTGMAIGRHKLAPTVSPNKTVEGFVGGILGAIAIGIIMYFWKLSDIGIVHILTISVGASIFGQLGDLVESMWKRGLGIKDSSAIIPGHGGVLDRFDSLLFAAPFMYFYLQAL